MTTAAAAAGARSQYMHFTPSTVIHRSSRQGELGERRVKRYWKSIRSNRHSSNAGKAASCVLAGYMKEGFTEEDETKPKHVNKAFRHSKRFLAPFCRFWGAQTV